MKTPPLLEPLCTQRHPINFSTEDDLMQSTIPEGEVQDHSWAGGIDGRRPKIQQRTKNLSWLLRMAKVKDLPVESPIQEDEKSPDITLKDGTETRNYC